MDSMAELEPKPVSVSQTTYSEIVLPHLANNHGSVLGGHVMHLMDMVAAMAAIRHSRRTVVTASVDRVDFLGPVHIGEIIILEASVNYAGRTSMEIGVRVTAENPKTGNQWHTSSAYLTFVAVDEHNRPIPVPAVVPESEEEKRRYSEGEERRKVRLTRRK